MFFGTNRPEAISTLDYDEYTLFPLENTISLELLPVEELGERLCLYDSVFYADGTRGDRIADWETGEILETLGRPGSQNRD